MLRARAVDRAGNRDRHPARFRWSVRRWEPDIKRATQYARSRAGRVTFSVDVGWRTQGFGGSRTSATASTIKAMLLVAYLRRGGVRNRSLSASEKATLNAMIRASDNGAASRTRDLVGPARIKRLARRAGMKRFRYDSWWGLCRTSAKDQALFMRRFDLLTPKRHRGFARRALGGVVSSQRWGIGTVGHRGWRLYFKGGWGISAGSPNGTVHHQVAQLRRGDQRIGVAILSQDNPSHAYGAGTLRGVAKRLLRGLPGATRATSS